MDSRGISEATSASISKVATIEGMPLPGFQAKAEQLQNKIDDSDIEKTAVSSSDQAKDDAKEKDSNIVDWNGPDDPDKALNWPSWKKWVTVSLLGILTLLTPFASSMFAPSVDMVMIEFHNSNMILGSFAVSVYLLGYAFGPLILGPLSELYGRQPLYYISTVIFILFNVACAKSTNFPMLIIFRVLTGIAGSCPLTIGPGSIADMFKQEERGKIMAIWTLPILLGPSLGPVAGGYLSESLGWRWDFWFLIIVTGAVFILSLFILKETYPPKILERRVQRLRKETGNNALESALKSKMTPGQFFLRSIIRPTKMLFTYSIVFGLSVMAAIVYGTLYLLFTTMPAVFEDQYGFSAENVGLTYLGIGVGQIIGVTIFGMVSDTILRRMAKGGELKPEYRLPPLAVGTCFVTVGLLWYGWTTYFKVAYMIPIIGMGCIGVGMVTSFLPVATYLVDAFTDYAASATAASTVLRSIGGALLPLCGSKMYDALGLGWGNTLLAFIAMANLPLVLLFIKYGERIRMKSETRLKNL